MRRALLVASLLVGCGSTAPPVDHPTADARVGRWVSPARTFRTNLFWIDAPEGVVLVDTGFLPSDAEAAVAAAERATGKRVVLAVVLHANPDKFNGAHYLRARGIEVVTSQAVIDLVPHVHAIRHRAFASRYPGEYPDAPPELEAFASETLEVAGTTLTLHALGPGCSDAHVALEWEGHVFVGDLVANGHHAWLELGHVDAWRARLDEIAALGPRYVHPGRGASGGPELLAAQRDYLDTVEAITREHEPTLPVDPARVDAVREAIEARYPGLGHAVFLRIGVPAVYRRLAEAS